MYQAMQNGCIRRVSDGAFIPADPANGDFAEYQMWLEEGNAPLPEEGGGDATRAESINARLAEIDSLSVRHLRAIVAGAATDEDQALLASLDAEASGLRQEFASLGGQL